MDFNRPIYENRTEHPFIVAHRGVCGANIPCNTLTAFQIAIKQGADVIELDVAKSLDEQYFVFHPGMESVYLKCGKRICEMTADEIRQLPLLNQDELPTHYRIPTLEEALLMLKGKVYINVDKIWTDIKGITEVIRKCGVENQVIVKTPAEEKYFEEVERYAPDLMYLSVTRHRDRVTEQLEKRKINYIGTEVLFDSMQDETATAAYVQRMHEKGYLVWVNAIVYDEKDVISAGLTDDCSLEQGGEAGWGKLAEIGYDFIQTDWVQMICGFLGK